MTEFHRPQNYSSARLNLIWGIFVVCFVVVCFRLFNLQIIRHDEFLSQANAVQIKSLEIEAERGSIYAFSGNRKVPLVINERRWTLFSDTEFIEDLPRLILNLDSLDIDLTPKKIAELQSDSRYVVLQKGLTDKERLEILNGLNQKGVYFQKQSIRQYLEGDLASQVLGFLNDDSEGQYGIEQFYDRNLTGVPGRLSATTDVRDVPLLFVEDNVLIEPQAGEDVILTLDIPLQRLIELQLEKGIKGVDAKGGTVIVLDAETGGVLAMANYPNFNPANFREADIGDYTNDAVESILEPASVLKVLLMATALDQGVIGIDENYYNPKNQLIDGHIISNFVYHKEGYLPVTDILSRSLNTGSIEILKRLGKNGPKNQIDLEDRQVLYDYYKQNFRLAQKTGIDLPNEVAGFVHPPDQPWSPNHLYATMTFGQSITVTPLQLAAVYAAIFNGGNYYQPHITAQVGDEARQPKLLAGNILKPQTILDLRSLMVTMGQRNLNPVQYDKLEVSAKTGSAQVVDFVNGGYIDGVSTGLMIGYLKSEQQTMIIAVIIEEPQVGIAGFYAARPIWIEIVKNIVALGRINP